MSAAPKSLFALTIAGGRGERLKPLTDAIPKPMVPIEGEPLLLHQARLLMRGGVTDIVFLTGYRAESVSDFFGDGSKFGFRAHYSHEETPLGRGGAIRRGLENAVPPDAPHFIAINGDIITDQPLDEMIELHLARQATATILTAPYPNTYGVVAADEDGVVRKFAEKVDLPFWINGGVYVMQRSIEPLLPRQGDHEDSTFPDLARQGKLVALNSRRYWRAVDTHKDLNDASQNIRKLNF